MSSSSIVIELQRLASDGQASVTELLRKALIVATKLKIEDFRRWIDAELHGYKGKGLDIPEYRRFTTEVKFWNPYNGWIPLTFPDSHTANRYSLVRVSNSISEVEEMANRDDPSLVLPFSPEDEKRLMDGSATTLKPSRFLAQNHLFGITSIVRSTILQWSLTLEEEGILGEGMTFTTVEKERAAHSQSIHIQNFSGVLGNVFGQNVNIGDYGTIHQQLKDAGIDKEQRRALEDIIDEMNKAKPEEKKSWAQKGMDWLGKNADNIGNIAGALRTYFTGHLPPGS